MILWFRNDLRTHDNPALQYFINSPANQATPAPIVPNYAKVDGEMAKAIFLSPRNNGKNMIGPP
ncbi:deoxyribodipyrimidine photo-lyase [Psychrosphaera aquimarina]|uniref:Deoxyribodipyrimidine photo-lyase n=1 Tax=Psychrosphaera aquimarina TaxID=2044854 RepID=A0ABU3QWR8_9GAMM|nr:deoxyribodipyrimidine photo-lyase [Psychrosphaera aquimarina]MDU0111870.1 deoxyribodipyrimidine photo-lyase [Psychrosphaera aquimarina]